MTSNAPLRWLSAGCFLFAGVTALWIHPDAIIKWLGGTLFILMSLHGALWIRIENSNRQTPPTPRLEHFAGALTILIMTGWMALTLLKEMYAFSALFFAGLVSFAYNRSRRRESQQGAGRAV